MKDLIIIGAGPAGLSAAIYAIRAGIDMVLIEKIAPGGLVMTTFEVENYPGFAEPVPGWELMNAMESQARRLGAEIASGEVLSLTKEDGAFTLKMIDGPALRARSVICASGARLMRLGVPGEERFTGRGVSYCATCDAAFFKDKITAVAGGGNTALEEAVYLTRFVKKVYLIHRRDEFRGVKILQDRVFANQKIEPVLSSVVTSINGESKIDSVSIANKKTGAKSELSVDGVFIFIGYEPVTGYAPAHVKNERGELLADMQMQTPLEGLFAAGDLRQGSIRQIVAAAADGATAALSAYRYLEGQGISA